MVERQEPEPHDIGPETADLDRQAEVLGDGVERDQLHPPQPIPVPETDRFGPSEGQSRSADHPNRQLSPIKDALLDWRFSDEIVDVLRGLGVKDEPTGLPENRRSLSILDLNRTESQALLLGMARVAAMLWLQGHPASVAAEAMFQKISDVTGGRVMDFIEEVGSSFTPRTR